MQGSKVTASTLVLLMLTSVLLGLIPTPTHLEEAHIVQRTATVTDQTFTQSMSTITGGGSCGGGGPSDVYSFTAATAGTYHFTAFAEMEDSMEVDMLIFVRSFCGQFLADYELACNDDYSGLNSGVEVELTEGETVYLFVDSFNGGGTGAYNVTAASGALPAVEEE